MGIARSWVLRRYQRDGGETSEWLQRTLGPNPGSPQRQRGEGLPALALRASRVTELSRSPKGMLRRRSWHGHQKHPTKLSHRWWARSQGWLRASLWTRKNAANCSPANAHGHGNLGETLALSVRLRSLPHRTRFIP